MFSIISVIIIIIIILISFVILIVIALCLEEPFLPDHNRTTTLRSATG